MKTTQHTLNLPLKLVYYSNAWEIREASNALVLHISAGKDDIEAMAGARFIVTACNSHYELLEALKEIAGMAETGRQTVSEIVGARVGNAGRPSRMIDSAAAITRGSFLSITQKALAIVSRAEEKE